MTAVESPFKASFKVLGGAAAAIATMFSPARIFAPFDQPEPEPTAPNELADKTTAAEELGENVRRRVQMTKAFTALRADITTDKASPQKSAAPSKKKSPTKAAAPAKTARPSPKKAVAVQRKVITKVKSEPMRRSARSHSYKKGQFSEAALTKLAWSGQGTRASPYVC